MPIRRNACPHSSKPREIGERRSRRTDLSFDQGCSKKLEGILGFAITLSPGIKLDINSYISGIVLGVDTEWRRHSQFP